MSMKPSRPMPARETVRLPKEASNWTQHQIQEWCRKKLCGAPPAIPKEENSGADIDWKQVKNYAGRKLSLKSHFPGLIFNGKFIHSSPTLPMTKKGSRSKGGHIGMDNITDVSKVKSNLDVLDQFWKMIEELIEWYNQVDSKNYSKPCLMMWKAGKRMNEIMEQANSSADWELITKDSMRYSVAAWGVGHPKNGYGETQLEQCLKLYHWLPDADESHPILQHRTTPIMKLFMAESKDSDRRMNLFNAYDSGPLKGLRDEQLNWALGLSKRSFPHPSRWDELRELCDTIADGGSLSNDQTSILTSILSEAFSSKDDAA